MDRLGKRYSRAVVAWTVASTGVTEGITLYLRFGQGRTAIEFNRTAPLLLQIHHMFWSVPLFLAAMVIGFKCIRSALWGIGFGFIISDLAHHFLILPLTVGNTGWHWP